MRRATGTLSLHYLEECFNYDPDTGLLTWKIRPRSHFATDHAMGTFNSNFAGTVAGTPGKNGYLQVGISGRRHYAHRVCWALIHRIDMADVPDEIDHFDTDAGNNRKSNLRPATRGQNMRNVGLRKDNKSGYKGVSWNNRYQMWVGRVMFDNKSYYLGQFSHPEAANDAVRDKRTSLHNDFANHGDRLVA